LFFCHFADSCLVVPVDAQLSDNLRSDDGTFTLTAWFQSSSVAGAVSGTILSLSATNTSTIYYSLGFVHFDNGTTTVKFTLQVHVQT